MTRPMRILRNVAIGLLVLVMLVAVTGVLVVRTQWFRDYVRQKIVTATEEATGGRVAVGSFSFDWTHLSAAVTNLVIHGSEPAGSPPYLSAARVEIHVRLLTSIHRLLDITYLGIAQPQANITVAADGTTNVPKPKQTISTSNKSPLQTVVDLTVGHFDLSNGAVTFNSQKQDFDLRGESLHVQLWYNALSRSYRGEISLAPLYVVSGRNTPVKFLLDLPLTIGSDSIAVQNARIQTDCSKLQIDASLDNWQSMKTSAHIRGHLALVDLENLGNFHLALDTRGMPPSADVDIDAAMAANEIDVKDSRLAYGGSSIHASGKLRDPAGQAAMQLEVHVALAELGRMARLDLHPQGTLELSTLAKLSGQRLTLERLRIDALGAEIAGEASLEDFARYTVNAQLARLDLQTLMRDLGRKSLGYSGALSGSLAATGDLKVAGTKSLTANARLSVAPGRQGIPMNGRIIADYRGNTDNLTVGDSFLALPRSRINLEGSLGNRLNVAFTTTNLNDFSPLTGGNLPVVLAAPANFGGVISGQLTAPQIAGHLGVGRFAAEGRQFDSLQGDVSASPSAAELANGILRHGNMQAQFRASAGLNDWNPAQNQPLSAKASIRNADLADMLALAGTPPKGYSGALTADANISGTIGNPHGNANLTVTNGTLHGEPVDALQAQVNMTDQLVTVTNAEATSGPSRADLTAEFHHPRDRFDRGQIHAHLETNRVDLSKLRAVQNLRLNSGGTVQAAADFTGELDGSLAPKNVTADVSGHSLRIDGQNYGDFTATARTSGQTVAYHVDSDFAGSKVLVSGNTNLAAGYRTTADANIAGLPIERVLVLLDRTDIPAKGLLTAGVHVSGTIDRPEGSLDATVDRAMFDGEPIDRVHTRVHYLATGIDVSALEVRAGASALDATAQYDYKPGVLTAGELQFRVTNGHVDLAHIHHVQSVRPGLAGTLQLTADGTAVIAAGPEILPRSLNLSFSGKGLALDGKNLGDLTLTANTAGSRVTFAFDSNLAGASIQGKGDTQLTADYPVAAQMSVHNLNWKGLQPLLGSSAIAPSGFDAAADAEIALNGPALRTAEMTARLQLPRIQLTATTPGVRAQNVTVQNQGPVVFSMDHGVARIESLHLTGPQTDIQAQGSVSLTAQTLQGSVNAHTDLSLLQKFDHDILSSGQITADATLRGAFSNPVVIGKLQVQKASVHFPDVITGLSNANGEVDFNGTSASFRNLTGEVGGGKVVLGGFMAFSGATRMALHINATKVRFRPQEGVSATADADLRLSGRLESSVLSGTAAVNQITYAPKSDLGAILSRAAPAGAVIAHAVTTVGQHETGYPGADFVQHLGASVRGAESASGRQPPHTGKSLTTGGHGPSGNQ